LALLIPALPFVRFAGPRRAHLHVVRGLLDRVGIAIVANHYHEPIYKAEDIFRDPAEPRPLAGIDWNLSAQLTLLEKFTFREAVRSLDGRICRGHTFRYQNDMFGVGDAEALYSMIRHAKPRKFIEIGCGQSTLVAQFAIQDSMEEDPQYQCRHICYEPFENPWLNDLNLELKRERIERCDLSTFKSLSAGDIVFIDSSHVQRPMGDVEFEFLHILPILPPGVIIHIHDIFSPRDYPETWLKNERRFWNEQYLLEAFLSFNGEFEIICAMNDLMHRGSVQFKTAFPVLAECGTFPFVSSFWIRRKVNEGTPDDSGALLSARP
jgi:hypothetical protein